MKAKKSANSKVPSRALHAKSRKDSCTNNVHPDVILDADEALRYILGRLTKLEDEVAPIKIENKELKKRNGYLESQHRQDLAKIKKQNAEICTLKARLDKLEKPKKDSHNSNTPPSKEDIAASEERKRTKSLREPSGKKSGGQPGHKGSTLQREERSDFYVEVPLDNCPDCGEDLSNVSGIQKMTRQMIDINFPAPVITQYSILEKVCPNCGHTVCSEFPEGVNGDVFYGPLDFFSYHFYSGSVASFVRKNEQMKALLDKYSYTGAEMILNEWNYLSNWTDEYVYTTEVIKSHVGAAFCSAVMQVSQDGPVDMLMYYDARPNTSFNGLFDFTTFSTLPTYYSFYAWKKLRELGTQVYSSTGGLECVYVTAAKGPDGRMAILVTNCSEDKNKIAPCTFDIELRNTRVKEIRSFVTDKYKLYTETPLEVIDGKLTLSMSPNSFTLIEIEE